MEGRKEENSKLTYRSPRLRVIELVAEEILASGCKSDPTSGPDGIGDGCNVGTNCFQGGGLGS